MTVASLKEIVAREPVAFLGLLAAIVALIIAIVAIYAPMQQQERFRKEDEEKRQPALVDKGRIRPDDRPGLTSIVTLNPGELSAAIVEVRFKITLRFGTLAGATQAMPALDVHFVANDWDAEEKMFRKRFAHPIEVEGKRAILLRLAIVERDWVGFSYRGTVEVQCSDGTVTSFPGVIVDVIPHVAPEPQ